LIHKAWAIGSALISTPPKLAHHAGHFRQKISNPKGALLLLTEVRNGSKADIRPECPDVRFGPEADIVALRRVKCEERERRRPKASVADLVRRQIQLVEALCFNAITDWLKSESLR
jgi:hypothetical protein